MFLALVSVATLVTGVAFAPTGVYPAGRQAGRELVSGSLLATGLMLLGVGLQSAGG